MRALHLALFALCTLYLATCSPAPREPGPALWRIADANSEIWLFGTVHVLPADLHWRSARVDAAFASAEELITETDMTEPAQQTLAALALRHGVLPEGQSLHAMLSAPQRARMERLAAAQRQDINGFARLRPWLAALRLSVGYAVAEGHTPEAGVDATLIAEATARAMRLSYLESAEVQIRALADLAPADELRFLDATMRQIEDDRGGLDEMDQAWVRGDTVELARLIEDDFSDAGPAAYDALLTRRNRAWADEIARRLDGSGDIFIAVGAAHLVGPDSIVAMLRARGVEVEGP
jgi:uncharacterized protein